MEGAGRIRHGLKQQPLGLIPVDGSGWQHLFHPARIKDSVETAKPQTKFYRVKYFTCYDQYLIHSLGLFISI